MHNAGQAIPEVTASKILQVTLRCSTHRIYWINCKTFNKKQRKEAGSYPTTEPWVTPCVYVVFLWAVSAFPVDAVITKNRVETEQRGPTGGWNPEPTHTCSPGEMQRQTCLPTAITRHGRLSSHVLFLSFWISLCLGPGLVSPVGGWLRDDIVLNLDVAWCLLY